MKSTRITERAHGNKLKDGLVKFYKARGHADEEAVNYAERHLAGDSSFSPNPAPKKEVKKVNVPPNPKS